MEYSIPFYASVILNIYQFFYNRKIHKRYEEKITDLRDEMVEYMVMMDKKMDALRKRVKKASQ